MADLSKKNPEPELYQLALSYKQAADILYEHLVRSSGSEGVMDYLPIQFLYSHSVELILKSYLVFKGFSLEKLSRNPYGHDLVKIYEECLSKGLAISNTDKNSVLELIRWLVNGHIEYQYRYHTKSLATAHPDMTSREVTKLFTSVCTEIEQSKADWEKKVKEAGSVLLKIATGMRIEAGKGCKG